MVYKVYYFFAFYNTLRQHRIRLASFHMEGEALVWFQDLEDFGQFTSWDVFVKALLVKFGPNAYDEPMESLTKLR